MFRRGLIVVSIASCGACGGRVASDDATRGSDAANDIGVVDDVQDVSVDCVPSEPVSKEAVAATPRADDDAELLALSLGTTILADDATYDRLARDLAAMRAGNAALGTIHVRAPYDQSFVLEVDRATALSMQAKTYHAWDCENAFWGVTKIGDVVVSPAGLDSRVSLRFKGVYAIDRLACVYGDLPGVLRIPADILVGDGPTIFVWTEGDLLHYAFDDAGGDCPAGCTTHHVWHYSATADGSITLVEELYLGGEDAGVPPPWWSHRTWVTGGCASR
jgi:hypothetical protein